MVRRGDVQGGRLPAHQGAVAPHSQYARAGRTTHAGGAWTVCSAVVFSGSPESVEGAWGVSGLLVTGYLALILGDVDTSILAAVPSFAVRRSSLENSRPCSRCKAASINA